MEKLGSHEKPGFAKGKLGLPKEKLGFPKEKLRFPKEKHVVSKILSSFCGPCFSKTMLLEVLFEAS